MSDDADKIPVMQDFKLFSNSWSCVMLRFAALMFGVDGEVAPCEKSWHGRSLNLKEES
jgi:hypothetical protein